MLSFRKLISNDTLLRLYKAFIMSHFKYCSSVWHFCGARNEKIDTLDKRILRFILQDYNCPYDSQLSKVNSKSLYKRRLQAFLIILYRSLLFTRYPGYLRDMFSLLSTSCSLLYAVIIFCLYRLQEVLLMVYTPFRTWLQDCGTLFQIRLELLTFLISSTTFYSMILFNSLNFRML